MMGTYLIPQSQSTTSAALLNAREASETISDMLPAGSYVLFDDYFSCPTYPVKVLSNVAGLYVFGKIDKDASLVASQTKSGSDT